MTNNHPLANALTIESPVTQAMDETFDCLHAFRTAQAKNAPSHILAMLRHDLIIADNRRKTLSAAKANFALN